MDDFFEQNGYCIYRRVLDPDIALKHVQHFHTLTDMHPDIEPDEISSHLLQHDTEWYKIISSPELVNIANELLGDNIAHFYSRYFAKKPDTGREVPWHQDGAYYPLDPIRLCTLWLSLTDSTPENGCLKVIPGTHKYDLHALKEAKDERSILKRVMDITGIDTTGVVHIKTQPGDVVVIHPNLLHSSDINRSDKWRIGLAIRYIPTDVKITWESLYGEPWDCAFHLRGEALNRETNNYLNAPEGVIS
ncbi:phytanoyl-CoA dioxygenase family protein [Pantoea dispersa]|uniref:phytanoyl-CoA dioxygenase family protein n=1 Tax=Pantoea dispersa TaxID=59814 RepID=UPI0007377239|nr:phytanoyl-CoA dioxygenase family protein [Pantoea dispersa]KTR97197.1 hypothetical protein NS375_20875 [Pantoea dispersa]